MKLLLVLFLLIQLVFGQECENCNDPHVCKIVDGVSVCICGNQQVNDIFGNCVDRGAVPALGKQCTSGDDPTGGGTSDCPENQVCVRGYCFCDDDFALNPTTRVCEPVVQPPQPLPSADCSGNGDPHFVTFHDRYFDFMGTCDYVLLKSIPLTIVGRHFACGSTVSCISDVAVKTGNHVILINGTTLTANGTVISTFPHTLSGGITIGQNNWNQFTVTLADGAVVSFAYYFFHVQLPSSYFQQVDGLCGRWNFSSVLYTREGELVSQFNQTAINAFGDSWEVDDSDVDFFPTPNPSCISKKEDSDDSRRFIEGCIGNPDRQALAFLKCNELLNPGPPYDECFKNIDSSRYFANCVTDICYVGLNEELLNATIDGLKASCEFQAQVNEIALSTTDPSSSSILLPYYLSAFFMICISLFSW